MEFEHLDRYLLEVNQSVENLFWNGLEARGYTKEWILANPEKVHILECTGSNTFIFSVEGEELFSITCRIKFESLGDGASFQTEYSLTHL